MRAAEVVTVFQKNNADQNADGKTDQTDKAVHISACEAEPGAPRAAEENQSAGHGEESEDEADNRSGAAAGLEFIEQQSCDQ